MASKYWFKPKRYGYGAIPSSREGWIVTLIFIIITMYVAIRFEDDTLPFIIYLIIGIIIFITIAKKKTDGEWRWRWGK